MNTNEGSTDFMRLLWTAIGLAMGAAVIVLSMLDSADSNTLFTLLGLGLFGLALAQLRAINQDK